MLGHCEASPDRRLFIAGAGGAVLAGCAGLQSLHAQGPTWRPDGVGAVGRLGVLTPHFDPVPETEMSAMAPTGVSIHAARVWCKGDVRAFSEPPHIDEATELLVADGPRKFAGVNPSAILLAFTTTSYLLGADGARRLRERLEQRSNGVPVILPGDAATTALRTLGVRRISLFHPPWFTSNEQGVAYFRDQGFDVVQAASMEPERTFTEVAPAEVFAFVSKRASPSSEAVVVGGNGLRAVGVIEALEARLQRPVITANQVMLWVALRRIDQASRVNGYGRIFQM